MAKAKKDQNYLGAGKVPGNYQSCFVLEEKISDSSFNIESLGREIGMSRSQIHRKLKAITDQSATSFIRNYRLHRAADLLKDQVGNVTEIATR